MAPTNLPLTLESLAKTVRAMLAKREEELPEQRREFEEYRQEVRQIFDRLEQNDAAIRRFLDLLEGRLGGDGGRPAG